MNCLIEKQLAITKSVITHFRVFYHSKSCCPAFNSLKEWKFTLLHLEIESTTVFTTQFYFCRHRVIMTVQSYFLTFVVKFGVNISNTLEEINRNVAWKLENVVITTRIKQ